MLEDSKSIYEMSKSELLEEVKRLKSLPSTVQAKDKEIATLREKLTLINKEKDKEHSLVIAEYKREKEAREEYLNKVVAQNKEAFEDLAYLLQVLDTFMGTVNQQTTLVRILLRKYTGGDK